MDTRTFGGRLGGKAVVLYASMFGATEIVAERVADELTARLGAPVASRDITWFDPADLAAYDLIVIGSSTWNVGQLPSDMSVKLPQLAQLDLSGKMLALFGTGDQLGYPDTYLDAVGIIADELAGTGAKLIGSIAIHDYTFSDSLAMRDQLLLGLAVDEDNEPELTQARIVAWVDQLLAELSASAPDVETAPFAVAV
ncbi:MAG TPA: flavodoxin [Trueperaceae bacterium]|nr:flavodoxin [Trueperaceae bacterium]